MKELEKNTLKLHKTPDKITRTIMERESQGGLNESDLLLFAQDITAHPLLKQTLN